MKTERRQDLRTNELSTQLDEAGQYIKKNAVTLTIAVIAVVAVTAGGFAYHNSQENRRSDAWNAIDNFDPTIEPAEIIAQAEGVVAEDISPEITVAALLRIGDTAMQEYASPTLSEGGSDVAGLSSGVDWIKKAETAYTRIVNDFASQEIAAGNAMIALGVLAENRSDTEGARKWYDQVLKNEQLAELPLLKQAQYRLAGLDSWSAPIVFPPPMARPEPDPGDVAKKTATPPNIIPIDSQPGTQKIFGKTPPQASQQPKANTATPPAAPKPVPTTMPADSE